MMQEMYSKEEWRDIVGFVGKYQISSFGRVKSFHRGVVKIKKTSIDKLGYEKTTLYTKESGAKAFTIHRLVALMFLPNPRMLKEVNHKDGNKLNNHVENLEWCTRSENVKHAFDNGLKKNAIGKDNIYSKEFYQFDLEGNLIKRWKGINQAAIKLGIPDSRLIRQNLNGRSKTCGGFIFSFNKNINVKDHEANTYRLKIKGVNPITKEEVHFISIQQAKEFGYDPSNIVKCLKGNRKTTSGMIWEYED